MIEDTTSEHLVENHGNPIIIKPSTKGDRHNIFVLFVLYTLQGVPLGLSSAIPIILQNKHNTTYHDQAIFSFAFWPFSMKLLWAPLVDSLHVKRFGRRKSWLIPVQYSIGLCALITGFFINDWLTNDDKPNVNALTLMFFVLNFLAATQDIVVDGWALTMLKRENISYAAVCNTAGQSFGIFLGYGFLLILTSKTLWNQWRRSPQPDGVVSLEGYIYFWGVMYMAVTTLVAIFKTEKDFVTDTGAAVHLSIVKTYKLLFRVMKLPSTKMLVLIVITVHICFASVTAAFKLKLIDGGVTNDQITTMESLYTPLQLCLPFIIAKFTSKEKPFKHYFNSIPYRLSVGIAATLVVFFTPKFLAMTGPPHIAFKICLVSIYFLTNIMESAMLQLEMVFFSKISDPKIGGTNMTLMNTVSNIGGSLSYTAALWLIDILTFKIKCSNDHSIACSLGNDQNSCKSSTDGTCQVDIDGYYVETVVCTIYGVIWYFVFKKSVYDLQSKSANEWHVEIRETS